MKRKGVSPVIATVLLISIVVMLGLIVFTWFQSIAQEAIIKFGKNIELVCDDVKFEASYSSGILYLSNTGTIPIYNLKLQVEKSRNYQTYDLQDLSSNWKQKKGIVQGGTFTEDVSEEFEGANKIKLIPVLIGKSDKGDRIFVCEERNAEVINV